MASFSTDQYSNVNRKRLREAEAELILCKAHASKLEVELAGLKRNEKIRKIEESQRKEIPNEDIVDRVHKLEFERKALLIELKDTKDGFSNAKDELIAKTRDFDCLQNLTTSRLQNMEMKVVEVIAVPKLHVLFCITVCRHSLACPDPFYYAISPY